MVITDCDIREFRQRAKTELKSGCDCGRLRWDDVVVALCDEVEKLRDTLDHYSIHAKFSKLTEEALNAVNKIYDLVSKPCVVLEDVFQACQQVRAILYNPPVTKTPPRNCDRFNTGNPFKDAEDAYGAWQRYCDAPTIPPSCKVESAFRQWLFATAKPETEGETDGIK